MNYVLIAVGILPLLLVAYVAYKKTRKPKIDPFAKIAKRADMEHAETVVARMDQAHKKKRKKKKSKR